MRRGAVHGPEGVKGEALNNPDPPANIALPALGDTGLIHGQPGSGLRADQAAHEPCMRVALRLR
ncbi:MAG: hypothetical protein L0I62_09750 [Gammaproteobacteria bacterium]|nr:hypothetical protein [Gammaproteobacteria bacterium]